jgi:hypothetical protein
VKRKLKKNCRMGADISFVVEQANEHGDWHLASRPGFSGFDWYEDRAYECFSLLTGLDFSARLVRPAKPVAKLRGWPDDLSKPARTKLLSCSDSSSFGQSWLDVGDFQGFDWDEKVTWTYMASPPRGLKVTAKIETEVAEHARLHGKPPTGWSASGWSQDGFQVSTSVTRRSLANGFMKVVEDMGILALDMPHSVRCVFEFTR